MENLNITLEQLLLEIDSLINEKISGTNYLELFKSSLIEKINNLKENDLKNFKIMPLDGKQLEKEINLKNRKIQYRIEYFDKTVSKIKQRTKNDSLCLILKGIINITIYDINNDTKSININLLKNMGIVLSLNTVITSKIAEKSIIISISNN